MEFQELIRAFSDEIGYDRELKADEDGVVRVPMSEAGSIAFMEIAETRSLLMWSRIGELPGQNAGQLKDVLLKANFMGQIADGEVLSLAEDNGIYLHRYMPLDLTDADRFMEALTVFVETIANWGHFIAESAHFAPEEPPQANPPEWMSNLSPGSFLRV